MIGIDVRTKVSQATIHAGTVRQNPINSRGSWADYRCLPGHAPSPGTTGSKGGFMDLKTTNPKPGDRLLASATRRFGRHGTTARGIHKILAEAGTAKKTLTHQSTP